jgi:ATP-dependent Clp protease ATP-binding subunit ClpC
VFEAFTPAARAAVIGAAEASRRLGDDMIRSEHLLLGALEAGGGQRPVEVLAAAGVAPGPVRMQVRDFLGSDAAEALATLGIDLDQVRSRTEAVFGHDALRDAGPQWPMIPFSPHAKAAMNQTVLEAQARGSDVIDVVDVLTAVLHPGLSEAEQATKGPSYLEMARREGLYAGEKAARRIVRSLGADPDELKTQLAVA